MKPLGALNFDYQRRPNSQVVGSILLMLGLLSTVMLGFAYRMAQQELVAINRSISNSDTGPRRAGAAEVLQTPEFAERVRRANRVIERLALPWNKLFGAVGSANGDAVALLALEPNAASGQLKVIAEAPTPPAMLSYVARLQRTSSLTRVLLLDHQIQAEDAQKPVRFSLVAGWSQAP